jgi:hypothetical protein
MSDRRILIVAHWTAASPKPLAAVAERSHAGRASSCSGPRRIGIRTPRRRLRRARDSATRAAAGSHVKGSPVTDPYEAVRQTLERDFTTRSSSRRCQSDLPVVAPRPRPPHRAARRT